MEMLRLGSAELGPVMCTDAEPELRASRQSWKIKTSWGAVGLMGPTEFWVEAAW